MFGLIKLIFFLGFLFSGFFIFDYFYHLSSDERFVVKGDIVQLLDNGKVGSFTASLGGKMTDDFTERFWPKVKRALNCLGDSGKDLPR